MLKGLPLRLSNNTLIDVMIVSTRTAKYVEIRYGLLYIKGISRDNSFGNSNAKPLLIFSIINVESFDIFKMEFLFKDISI